VEKRRGERRYRPPGSVIDDVPDQSFSIKREQIDMKLATWNVNSLKVRLPQVLQWLTENPVDVLCLQETKTTDDKFPAAAIEAAGYQVAFSGQKTYNGVAILSKHPMRDVMKNNPLFADEQQRIIAATIEGMRVICAYVPNGQSVDSDKYQYKLRWLTGLQEWLTAELKMHQNLAILGDYNIAPADCDAHDPALWQGQVLVSERERAAFQQLCGLNLADAFRLFDQSEKLYSWWDYRQMAFRRNMGMRIDHILLSPPLAARCTACVIDKAPRKWEQPSDHTPVIATID
jgi:exodeoxyribonuclease-3